MFKEIYNKLVIVLLVIVVLFGGYLILNSVGGNKGPAPTPGVQIATVSVNPTAAPPKIQLTIITASDCKNCFDLSPIEKYLKQSGADVKLLAFDYKDANAQETMKKYNVKRVPAAILAGELVEMPQLLLQLENTAQKSGDGYILTAPPYKDLENNTIVGMVTVKVIYEKTCFTCQKSTIPVDTPPIPVFDLGQRLKAIGVGIEEELNITADSKEGKDLIEKYKLTRLPAVVVSKGIEAYPALKEIFLKYGNATKEGDYLLRELNPPFYNLETKKEEGLLSVVYITPAGECPNCYDYKLHTKALQEIGVVADSESIYDYNSTVGQKYVKTYNLTKLPVFLLSPDIKYYQAFMLIGNQIGTFEKDGWFVFRDFDILGSGRIYYDLTTKNETAVNSTQLNNIIAANQG